MESTTQIENYVTKNLYSGADYLRVDFHPKLSYFTPLGGTEQSVAPIWRYDYDTRTEQLDSYIEIPMRKKHIKDLAQYLYETEIFISVGSDTLQRRTHQELQDPSTSYAKPTVHSSAI